MNILVPIDDSDQSRAAIKYADVTFPDAEITAIHVIPVEGYWAAFADDPEVMPGYEQARDHAEELFEEARGRIDSGIDTRITTGNPAREIVDFAGKGGFDAVVIGSHGRTGATRVLLGSVAEAVARRSPVPVTIVR
ncbi:universal stress protein [Halalkalicoccus jeotgali]|uniref:UspA domain protein n=1 Tax=Halalkalicoccus jeotgali (strain DSM 18796 / CECT 7217 / JCM 14584 / KCTC 4019 / B3) TaxID=795797 RepID=D8J2L9_HALJB|nr:universal stress protein [Halalkalicoccus jeotgali]ADJ14976.1 UspA domain protein [Halalkalicoccus jeotgali B3]ELY35008.1 UspA domain-containing protein [Halalkalicoccus jeotgali B3]